MDVVDGSSGSRGLEDNRESGSLHVMVKKVSFPTDPLDLDPFTSFHAINDQGTSHRSLCDGIT